MATLTRASAIALLSLSLFACSEPQEEPTGVIPQGHLDAMEKAKGVESLLQDASAKALEDVDKIE